VAHKKNTLQDTTWWWKNWRKWTHSHSVALYNPWSGNMS